MASANVAAGTDGWPSGTTKAALNIFVTVVMDFLLPWDSIRMVIISSAKCEREASSKAAVEEDEEEAEGG